MEQVYLVELMGEHVETYWPNNGSKPLVSRESYVARSYSCGACSASDAEREAVEMWDDQGVDWSRFDVRTTALPWV